MIEDPLVLFAIFAVACGVIGVWVAREFGPKYGSSAVVVLVVCAVVALVMVWINYEVFSFNSWAAGSWWRSLIVFVPSLVVGLGVWWWHSHSRDSGTDLGFDSGEGQASDSTSGSAGKLGSGTQAFGWILALAIGPGLITYLPRVGVGDVLVINNFDEIAMPADPRFVQIMWWGLASIALYVLIPVSYSVLFRQRIRDYGLSLKFVKTEIVLFLLVAPVIAVLVWLATADLRFQHMYPFYAMQSDDPNGVTKLLIFEVVYGLSFVALEFFFRGFLVHAGNRVVGVHAVALMALSYCLIHLGKPLPECLSSLVGGLLLGYVSLKLKSIAVGVVAHLTMAWGTDAAVLWRAN